MAVLEELQQQVNLAIKPWKLSDAEPPYSPAELITMALVVRGGISTEENIHSFIGNHFNYYRNIRFRRHAVLLNKSREARRQVLAREMYLREGFWAMDLPAAR